MAHTQPQISSAQILEQSILGVFTGSAVAEGNAYILSAVETDAVWGDALALFDHHNEVVRFFASNIVYTKVKRHWGQLGVEQKESLFRVLMAVLDNAATLVGGGYVSATLRQFFTRIMLSFSCVCAYAPGGIQLYIQTALRKLDLSTGTNAAMVLLALEMLTVLPPEVEALDVSHSFRLDLQARLLEVSDSVMATIDYIARATDVLDDVIKVATMKALGAWLLVGITLSKLNEDHEPSLRLVYESLQSGHHERIREGCSFVRAVICTTEYPSSTNADTAVLQMARHIVTSMSYIFPLFREEGNDEIALDVCTSVVSLTTQQIKLLASPQTFNQEIFDLLLLFAAFKPRKIGSITFDAWLALQELPVVERHPYVTQEVFYKVLGVVMEQCTYPHSWENSCDEEDFLSFRDTSGSVQEVLLGCFYALQDAFFLLLEERLSSVSQLPIEGSWNSLESVLFTLHAVMDAIKGAVNSEGGTIPLQFLLNALQLVLGIPMQCIEKCELASSACKFIGSLTFLLTGAGSATIKTSPFRDLFAPSLEYVFHAIENGVATKAAAKAIYQLCIHGRVILTTALADNDSAKVAAEEVDSDYLICTVVSAAAHILNNHLVEDEDSLALVIEGVVRCIVLLPHGIACRQINLLGKIVIDGINNEITAAEANTERIGKLLLFSSYLIKFCDTPHASSANHILYDFLSTLWPQLNAVEGHPQFYQLGTLSIQLLDVYSHAILSASSLVMPEIPRITRAIVSMFQLQGAGSAASLKCAKCIVDVLSDNLEAHVFLAQLVEYLTIIFYTRVQETVGINPEGSLWGYDPECIEAFFNVLLTCLCSSPSVLALSSRLPQIPQLCLATLQVSRERKTIQGVLQVLQTLYYSTHSKLRDFQDVFFDAAYSVGQQFVTILIDFMSAGIPSTLWSNVTDALHHIITGCEASHSNECRMWFQLALSDLKVFKMMCPEDKEQVVTIMFDLATKEPTRKFKVFIIDLCKIGSAVLSVDVLGAYA